MLCPIGYWQSSTNKTKCEEVTCSTSNLNPLDYCKSCLDNTYKLPNCDICKDGYYNNVTDGSCETPCSYKCLDNC